MENIYSLKVRFGDTDAAGIVFYPNYYRWMDQASAELLGNKYIPVSELIARGDLIPLLETFCQYKGPLFFEDEFDVYSKVIEMHNKTFKIEHVFKRGETLIATGYEVRAWTRKIDGKMKAVSIPEDVRAVFGFSELTKKS
ncbi:acyl-CoA thioesterase [Aquibacillus sediminis]|uniref:acyl-CoA thioesterase n=1 Tax=Aquibacillus sediminis TaxID=2574734 RepID=UPI001108D53D|nr:thioesterase family protein [Aquibacillus sediminis]